MPSHIKNVVIVNAYGRSNRGDAVLLDECVSDVRKAFPQAKVTVSLFEGCEAQPEFGVEWSERIGNAKGSKTKGLFYLFVCLFDALAPRTRLSRLLPPMQRVTREAIGDADLVVSAPGGYIHDTNTAFYVALFHIFLGVLLRKRVVLAPQSVGPLRSAVARLVAKQVLQKTRMLCAREPYSEQFLAALGLPRGRIVRTGDSAFWSHDVEGDVHAVAAELERIGLRHEENFFGMTVVGWSYPQREDRFELHKRYVASMAAVAEHVYIRYGLRPVILNQVSDDIETARKVALLTSAPVIVDDLERPAALLRGMIARSCGFVGTRFHSCIFAISAAVPTFAIAYLPKTRFILEDFGLTESHMDITSVDQAALVQEVDRLLADRGSMHEALKLGLNAYRQKHIRFSEVLLDARVVR